MAAPFIQARTIAFQLQNAISMNNGLFARSLSIPANWQKVRLGCRLHMTDSGANLPGTPTFAMGLCKGTTACMGDAVATHFAGINTLALGGNGGQRGPTYYYSNFTQPVTQVGAVITEGLDMSAAHKWTVGNQAAAQNSIDVSGVFLTITKAGGGVYNFQTYWNFSATPSFLSLAQFLQTMPIEPAGGLGGLNYELSTVQGLGVNEALNGVFDSINFYFNPTVVNMEICTVGFCQLA